MKTTHPHLPIWLFAGFGSLAIATGGLLAAFSASQPTRLALWACAYLILVVGIMQIGLGIGTYLLTTKPSRNETIVAFVLYNLGNAAVLLGTALKYSGSPTPGLVDVGSGLLVLAMLLFLYLVRGAARSWQLYSFYAIVAVLLISLPIGLILSRM